MDGDRNAQSGKSGLDRDEHDITRICHIQKPRFRRPFIFFQNDPRNMIRTNRGDP